MDAERIPHLLLRRVERQHAEIEHLCSRAPRVVTAAALADAVGVAVRTVERDMARLREAGLPVEVRRGPGGGYRMAGGSAGPRSVELTRAEIAALVASLVAFGPWSSASAARVLAKLLAELR